MSKGLKASSEDIKRLTEVFNYYDEKLSDDFPSLVNEVLQNCDTLINNYFNDTDEIIIDGYKIKVDLTGRYNDISYFDINVSDKSGWLENSFKLTIKDNRTNSNYDKDSFNAVYNACKEVHKEIKQRNIESIINTFKL